MLNFFRLFIGFIMVIFSNINYAKNKTNTRGDLINMSCSDLMIELIVNSSFNNVFQDKNLSLEFFFERYNERCIMLTAVKRAGDDAGGIYANFELDLVDKTLEIIDPDPPIKIKINKVYISHISTKCTPDQNLYGNTGRLPDKEIDGDKVN